MQHEFFQMPLKFIFSFKAQYIFISLFCPPPASLTSQKSQTLHFQKPWHSEHKLCNSDPNPDADPDIDTDNVPDIDTDNVPDIDTDNVPDPDTDNVPDIDTDNVPDPDIDTDNVPDIDTDNVPGHYIVYYSGFRFSWIKKAIIKMY